MSEDFGTAVCGEDALARGEMRRFVVGHRAIVLCRSATGEYFAVSDNCPHQGASMCRGRLDGMMISEGPGRYGWGRDGEILRCPWHAWEFDVHTGVAVWGDEDVRLATYPVTITDGQVRIHTRRRGTPALESA